MNSSIVRRGALCALGLALAAGCSGSSSSTASPTVATESSRSELVNAVELKDFPTLPLPYTQGSTPRVLTPVGDSLYYSGEEFTNGPELRVVAGADAGISLVGDLYPGPNSGGIREIATMGGEVYVSAGGLSVGIELWKVAPTGLTLVKDINPTSNGLPSSFAVVGSTLFFAATDAQGGELWKSDGTAAGTVQVKDLKAGSLGSDPVLLTAVGSLVFFVANDGSGPALWKSDGTAAGTVKLLTTPAPSSSEPFSRLTAVGNRLFFVADGPSGKELWKSDGTSTGTVMVKDLYAGSASANPDGLVDVSGTLFFCAYDGSITGLFKSDGTATGTVRLTNPSIGQFCAGGLVRFGNGVFFAGGDQTVGLEPYVSDGTAAGTHVLKDIVPGYGTSMPNNPVKPAVLGNRVFFVADDGSHGPELWMSDGTAIGTVLLKDVFSGPYGSNIDRLTATSTRVYFTASDDVVGEELWRTDGTTAGTALVGDLLPNVDTSGARGNFLAVHAGSTLIFNAYDTAYGYEPWRSDGTPQGTSLLQDITSGPTSSGMLSAVSAASSAYLYMQDSAGHEIWKTDGTSQGTATIGPQPGPSAQITKMVPIGSRVYFGLSSPWGQFWRTDGTSATTVKLADSQMGDLAQMGGNLYASLWDYQYGGELWKTDGTPQGTTLVQDSIPGSSGVDPNFLTPLGNQLLYIARTPATGYELWKSDGSDAGTGLLKEIAAGTDNSVDGNHPYFVVANGYMFFVAYDAVHGLELWRTDGTFMGTQLVKELVPGTGSPNILRIVAMGSNVYFIAEDPTYGAELWKSDGTAAGTTVVKDLWPGPAGGVPYDAALVSIEPEGVVVFAGSNGQSGLELWRTDGTANGTVQLTDINPGPGSSTPVGVERFGNFIGFGANKGDSKVNPWAIPLSDVIPDRTAPVLTCPNDVTAEASSSTGALVSYASATATDNKTANPTISYSVASGTVFALGTTGVTVTAVDEAGNQSSCTFSVIVSDTTPPTVTCPSDLTASATAASGVAVSYASATGTDTVSAVTLSYSAASGDVFPVGTTTVVATAMDGAGNSATCSFSVVVTFDPPDAGSPDAGSDIDAGAAESDAGSEVDDGAPDAGVAVDAGASVDAGSSDDAGTIVDAGTFNDAGTDADAGSGGGAGGGGGTEAPSGCGCGSTGGASIALWAIGAMVLRRRRIAS